MQVHNVNLPIVVTGRHVDVTEAMREYARKKVEGLHLDYPRIIEAKVVLDVQKHHNQQMAEIVLFCANHIVIEADSTSPDIYASIDETISKIARRMRKYKTRMLKSHRPRKGSVKHIEEHVFEEAALEATDEHVEAAYVHKEPFKLRPLYPDEAMLDLAMSDRSFVVFENASTHKLSILYRRRDGEFGLIEPEMAEHANGNAS
ncbi:MAG: ribosome-associated translation inhibitor RaiA [Verrucomicrobiaceae bacterium]|nr:ribosome-associated translation inhibitor RaiA [Verrucomicrobiaceae bacterium]